MSSSASNRVVDFDDPPLNEVVFSVQFEDDVVDEVGILSDFWPTIRPRFPRHEKHPAMPPAVESFEVPPAGPEIQMQLLQGAPPQRYWFLSEDQTLIVQVQTDRLMFNWRQVVGDEAYPHYDALAPQFADLLSGFLACEAVNADAATVAWVELQYVNPIESGGDETHGQLARVLKFLVSDPPRKALPPVEDTQIQQRFRLSDAEDSPRGRLYLTAVPAFSTVGSQPLYVVTLLARGRPDAGDVGPGVQGFLDHAHDLIVNGFAEVTTDEMHNEWGVK